MPATQATSVLSPETIAEAVARFERGESMRSIATWVGMSWQRLWGVLRDAGATHPVWGGRAAVAAPAASVATAAREPASPRQRARRASRRPALTYGIEIECTMPRGTVTVGGYRGGDQIVGLPEGWKAKGDSSITPRADGHVGVEVVSPILRGDDGVRQIMTVTAWLASVGAKVNASCGFHVHVGWNGNAAALARLVKLVAKNERGLYAATGTKARERSHFTQPISNNPSYAQLVNGTGDMPGNRYQSLNLTNLRRGGKHTVEFRAFAGTINATKIVAYVFLCLGFVAKAKDERAEEATWAFSEPHTATGSVALSGLMSDLGWGNCTNYGIIAEPTAPTTLAMAFELGRLAQKYDGNAEPEGGNV